MVPEPSMRSPPIPFIGAESEWEEPYITAKRRDKEGRGDKAVAGPRARQRGDQTRQVDASG